MTTYILTMDNEFVSLEKSAAEAVAVIESGRANKLEKASTIDELEQILKRIKTGTEPKQQVSQPLDDLAEFFKRFSSEKSANQQKLKKSMDELRKSLDDSKRILLESWKDICQKVEDAFKS